MATGYSTTFFIYIFTGSPRNHCGLIRFERSFTPTNLRSVQAYGFTSKEEETLEFPPTELENACKALYPDRSCELKNGLAWDYLNTTCSGRSDLIEQLLFTTTKSTTTTTATTDTINSLRLDKKKENKENEVKEILLWVLSKRMNELKRIVPALKDFKFEKDEIKFENMIKARLP